MQAEIRTNVTASWISRMVRALTAIPLVLCLSTPAALAQGARFAADWPDTDFSRLAVDLSEVISGGPPRDGIPAVMDPTFGPASAERSLDDREPVMTYVPANGPARAYPIRYLMWHEIVNDTLAGTPVAVTFCPLCNTAMVFDTRVGADVLSFGVSGLLRFSDMIMYDRQTDSWWQQATAAGIAGHHSGTRLTQLPAVMESWADFAGRHPQGLVMDQPDWPRNYGANPYRGYDSAARPFLYSGEDPPHGIHPLARVVRVGERAWPLDRVRAAGTLTEAGVILTWSEGQASALDSGDIGAGTEVGTVRVRDAAGVDVVHDMPFAFAFHAFHPDGTWMLAD
jgi:hypothetical protein